MTTDLQKPVTAVGKSFGSIGAALAAAIFTLCGVTQTLHAQRSIFDSVQTATGWCRVWSMIPGGSNPSDSSYNRCALDKAPVRREGSAMPANPLFGLAVGSDLIVIVKEDGTVDPRLSRYLSYSGGDEPFHKQALQTIKSWRFEPGRRRNAAVRSGFQLRITSDKRNDTIPATLEWSYRTGQSIDTLQGTWRRVGVERPFSEKELDSMYLSVVRHLADIRVLRGRQDDRYCIVLKNGDTAAQSRLTKAARDLPVPNTSNYYHLPTRLQIADIGCERADSVRRIILPRLVRTEGGRAAFVVSGDFLPNYPAGFRGRSWNAYTGRCVGQLQLVGPATMHCDVVPEGQLEEQMQWFRNQENFGATEGAPEAGTKPIRVGVYYNMRGAFQADTVQRELAGVPQLADFAVTDSLPGCGKLNAYSQQVASALYIAQGNPSANGWDLRPVIRGAAPQTRGVACTSSAVPQRTAFATFLLDGVGDSVKSPITVCMNECNRNYVVDPAKRPTLVPIHRFKISEMQPDSRRGEQLDLRVQTNQATEGFRAFVVFQRPGDPYPSAQFLYRVNANSWDLRLRVEGGYPSNTEVLVYAFEK